MSNIIFRLFIINILLVMTSITENARWSLGIGLIINTIINHVLKRIINEPRPIFAAKGVFKNQYCSSYYGMPSGHAQFYGFLLGWFIKQKIELSVWKKIIIIGLSSIELYYKYSSNCHDIKQLLYGGIIGYSLGYLFPFNFFN